MKRTKSTVGRGVANFTAVFIGDVAGNQIHIFSYSAQSHVQLKELHF